MGRASKTEYTLQYSWTDIETLAYGWFICNSKVQESVRNSESQLQNGNTKGPPSEQGLIIVINDILQDPNLFVSTPVNNIVFYYYILYYHQKAENICIYKTIDRHFHFSPR